MIQAIYKTHGTSVRMLIIHPEKENSVRNIPTAAEGARIVYFMNRDNMLAKLNSWLNQRAYSSNRLKAKTATQLKGVLHYHKNVDLNNLCLIICRDRNSYELAAPHPKDKLYPFYQNNIVPILDDAAKVVAELCR